MRIVPIDEEKLSEAEKKNNSHRLIEFIEKLRAAWGYPTSSKLPIYQPNNEHWEATFRELGWSPSTVGLFYQVFHRLNTSCTGEVSFEEFINFFELQKTKYTRRCFEYFATAGGNSINFLEFMVSVWNICTANPDTLVNFAFDLYNLNSDGKLIYPEMKVLIEQLYGVAGKTTLMGKQCLAELTNLAGTSDSAFSLENFAFFASNHSMLLYPAFQIQQSIQQRVLGLNYWEKIRDQQENRRKNQPVGKEENKPRDVQKILRTCKARGAAAASIKKRDSNESLREWYGHARDLRVKEASHLENQPTLLPRWNIFCSQFFIAFQKFVQQVFNRSTKGGNMKKVRHTSMSRKSFFF